MTNFYISKQNVYVSLLSLAGLIFPGLALAETQQAPGVNFHVVTHYRVPLTVLHADLVAQATGKHPSQLAVQVNRDVAWMVAKLRAVQGIHWRSTGYQTNQLGPKGRKWTVRETVAVWSDTPKSLLPILGTLQSRLQLAGMRYAASSSAQRKAMQQAVVRGLHRYRTTAKQDCKALGFSEVHLGQVFINTNTVTTMHPFPIMMAARAVPGPVVGQGGAEMGRVVVGGSVDCVGHEN